MPTGLALGLAAGPRPSTCRQWRRPRTLRVACSAQRSAAALDSIEAVEALFERRLAEKGWRLPPNPHELVEEAWRALDQIYPAVFETPLEPSPWLAQQSEAAAVFLKLESRQASGSFKARGAVHKLFSLTPEQLAKGLYTSSTGNHALAVLHACQAAGQRAGVAPTLIIYLPTTASPSKVAKLQEGGATVVLHGTDCVEAEREARRVAVEQGGTYISPYNDLQVAGGQGTVALELLMQLAADKLDAVFVPVGGGGLVAGMAAVLKAASPGIRVVGCQPTASDVMRRSVEEGCVVELPWQETLSDGTAGGIEEGSLTLEPCRQFVDEWVTVSEGEIARAMLELYTHHGTAVEGAAGVAVASFLRKAPELRGKHVVVVVCGGNVDKDTLDRAYRICGLAR